MGGLDRSKGILREHPYSRGLYSALGHQWILAQARYHKLFFGRYHTATYFDRLFSKNADPWGYVHDPVSEKRRDLILGMLPKERFGNFLEIGCATGWMTFALASRAEKLLATDISSVALARARERCRDTVNVQFQQMDVLTDPIPAGFDCVLCAGVLVFLPEDSQLRIRNRLVDSLPDEGFLMLEHTQPPYPGEIAGRIVHRFYHDHPELNVRGHVEVENYAITLFQKASM